MAETVEIQQLVNPLAGYSMVVFSWGDASGGEGGASAEEGDAGGGRGVLRDKVSI